MAAGMENGFRDHVQSGVTTLCRCWAVTRRDGLVLGFTDHDCALRFDGIEFAADTGLSALALQQGTGLSVDNTEALGALSAAAIREEDIEAGRFDGAELRAWLVNWADVSLRWLQFFGSFGEVQRNGGAFRAELRGLTEALNRPLGRVYQKPCTAVLGDGACRFDLDEPGYVAEPQIEAVAAARVFTWADMAAKMAGFEPGWFSRGRLEVLEGAGAGLGGLIKADRFEGTSRVIELWEPVRARVQPGERVRLVAGCDKRMETCRLKFNNLVNFQGFPDLPGEDWMVAVPRRDGANTGGSRR